MNNRRRPSRPTRFVKTARRLLAASGVAIGLIAISTTAALAHEGSHGVAVGGFTLVALPLTLIAVTGILAASGYFMYTALRERDLPLPADESPTESAG